MAAEDLMDKVFSLFSGDGLTDDKQNMLKGIAKELGNSKYAKFFRVRSEEADPSFSSFLFSIYRVIYPLKNFFKDETKQHKLRSIIIQSCLDAEIQDTINKLDYSNLDEKAGKMAPDALINSIKADLDLLVYQFNFDKMSAVNHRYHLASILGNFVKYNFAGFFKKFDPHFADGSFIVEPKFPAIKAILIIDQIGEFLTVTHPLKPEEDWNGLLHLIKLCEGEELVNPAQFGNMIKMIREVQASKILELMVQYVLRNPVWVYKVTSSSEGIADTWLEAKKAEANSYIAKINLIEKNKQIRAMTAQIFETTDLIRLENYNPVHSEPYRRKNLEYFYYAEGINYLKSFIVDYVDTEIKELLDILLIRGQWTNIAMSKEMSEALHELTEMLEQIDALDLSLSEDGDDGSRLRSAMNRVDRDSTQVRYINSIVNNCNEEAKEIISTAAKALITIGKHLKNLIEDLQKKHPELLINWKELNLASKDPLLQRMIADFKKINYFIQLMRLCTQ